MGKNKRGDAGGSGVRTGNISRIKDSQVAIGENINQNVVNIKVILTDYKPSFKEGKFEDVPESVLEALDSMVSQVVKAESGGAKLSTDAYFAVGLDAFYRQDFDAAEKHFIKAVEADPDNLQARNLLCTVYASRSLHYLSDGRFDDVISESRKAESYFHYESIAESLILLGYIFKNMYQANSDAAYLEKAKEKFEIALALDSKNERNVASANNGLGNYFSFKGDHDAAVKRHLEAIRILPDYAEAHNDLGIVYIDLWKRSGKTADEYRQKAIGEFELALQFAGNDPNFSEGQRGALRDCIRRLSNV